VPQIRPLVDTVRVHHKGFYLLTYLLTYLLSAVISLHAVETDRLNVFDRFEVLDLSLGLDISRRYFQSLGLGVGTKMARPLQDLVYFMDFGFTCSMIHHYMQNC